jgi:hypothetical protein
MVSAKLVHQIEDHWEAITARFLRRLRQQHGLPHISRMPESVLTDNCRKLLRNLGHWLVSSSEDEIAAFYEKVGHERYNQGIPLSESIRAVQLLKESALEYIRDEAFVQTSVDLYAEEELELQLGRFFDLLVYHLARGYERACGMAREEG